MGCGSSVEDRGPPKVYKRSFRHSVLRKDSAHNPEVISPLVSGASSVSGAQRSAYDFSLDSASRESLMSDSPTPNLQETDANTNSGGVSNFSTLLSCGTASEKAIYAGRCQHPLDSTVRVLSPRSRRQLRATETAAGVATGNGLLWRMPGHNPIPVPIELFQKGISDDNWTGDTVVEHPSIVKSPNTTAPTDTHEGQLLGTFPARNLRWDLEEQMSLKNYEGCVTLVTRARRKMTTPFGKALMLFLEIRLLDILFLNQNPHGFLRLLRSCDVEHYMYIRLQQAAPNEVSPPCSNPGGSASPLPRNGHQADTPLLRDFSDQEISILRIACTEMHSEVRYALLTMVSLA